MFQIIIAVTKFILEGNKRPKIESYSPNRYKLDKTISSDDIEGDLYAAQYFIGKTNEIVLITDISNGLYGVYV